jgi:DNA end-binding protein Ku
MPRAIWSGSVSFGLVNVPVRMYSAIEAHDLHFSLLHTKDDSHIGYEKICKQEGKPVPDDEIEKAYEIGDGEFVYLTDADFEAAEGTTYRTIELSDFVRYEEIDPIYFETTYFLGPDEGSEKAYALLVEAMSRTGLVGLGTFVMRNKQHLGCVRVRDGVLTLVRMYFEDEVRPHDEVKPKRVSVGSRELEMAEELIDRFSGTFDIGKYRDDYRDALLAVVKAKQRGETVEVEEPREEAPPDLLAALQASLAGRKGASQRRTRTGRNGGRRKPRATRELSKDQLVQRARRAHVSGYSKMTKDELVHALESR